MTCEQFQDRLTAFSLGELEPHEAVAAREHVARCSGCASRALLLVPAPAPASPLTAAWTAYRTQPLMTQWDSSTQARLTAVLGPAAETPNLTSFGYRVQGAGGRMLAGHLAAVTEYRDMAGHRMTLIRWKGDLPEMASA